MNSEKLLMITYLMFNLVILNTFQGNLIYVFNRFESFTEFNNLQEFLDADIPVLPYRHEIGRYYSSEEVRNSSSEFKQFSERIKSAVTLINITDPTYIITNFDCYAAKGFAILTSKSMAKKRITESMRRNNGSTSLVLLSMFPFKGSMVSFLNKKIRFLPQLDDYILRLKSSNLISKWYESSVDLYNMKKMMLHLQKGKNVHQFMLLELQVCFILYAVGTVISCITLIVELLYTKLATVFNRK